TFATLAARAQRVTRFSRLAPWGKLVAYAAVAAGLTAVGLAFLRSDELADPRPPAVAAGERAPTIPGAPPGALDASPASVQAVASAPTASAPTPSALTAPVPSSASPSLGRAPTPDAPPARAVWSGRVVDTIGQPVGGARVTLFSRTSQAAAGRSGSK